MLSGFAVAEATFRACDADVALDWHVAEGERLAPGTLVLTATGDAAALLAAERTALNFLQRLSGVATLTRAYADAVAGTSTRILDTRKTTPGLRLLEKAAVAHGGGTNHRVGLYDEVLIKENHAAMAGGVGAAVRAARERFPDLPLVCEVRDLAELDEALAAGAPRLLLDNFDEAGLREAVARVGDRADTESSGGVTLDSVRARAATGVDFISVGALTHSAPALDLSLILEPLT
ncbi:carboxylating nicotinate-nucleotide diphosphorylase [Conexibacter sp. W3-3-2]|uniref:carboxylating nicotinate-nucleotide diphosphorylase n=1 Tax=Conexibacter sp. W3-3-2 TaxID=2675227 RepID=UPI00281509F8|nr:carboxylating nicotinate-nucleotide diphosphorylase [Conexibacter sp. W3-3-2]